MINTLERINIKDFTVEGPVLRPRFPFDPEKEISSSQWRELEEGLQWAITNGTYYSQIYSSALCLSLLSPERYTTLDFTGADWEDHKESLTNQHSYDEFVDHIIALKSLFPEKLAQMEHYPVFDQITNTLSECRTSLNWGGLGEWMVRGMLLFPDRIRGLVFSDEEKGGMSWSLEHQLHERYFEQFCEMAANYKIIAPAVVEEFPISGTDWQNMKNWLDTFHLEFGSGEINRFLMYAKNLLILSADKVSVIQDGLVITKRATPIAPSQMPVQRRF